MNSFELVRLLEVSLTLYSVCLFIYILFSWIPRVPPHPLVINLYTFLKNVVEPYLSIFRRFIPPVQLGGMALDLSPIVAIIVLQLAGNILISLIS